MFYKFKTYIPCPETPVTNHESALCNIPEERRSHLHNGGRVNSRTHEHLTFYVCVCTHTHTHGFDIYIHTQNPTLLFTASNNWITVNIELKRIWKLQSHYLPGETGKDHQNPH